MSLLNASMLRSISLASLAAPTRYAVEVAVPKLLEPLMIDSTMTRFRSFNITLPAQAVGSLNPAQSLPMRRSVSVAGPTTVVPKPPAPFVGPNTCVSPGWPPAYTPTPLPNSGLFRPASSSTADTEFHKKVTAEFAGYMTAISHAIVLAHDDWRARAYFRGVQIHGGIAKGGTIAGPSMAPIIAAAGPQEGVWESVAALTKAIAEGIGASWDAWAQSVRVPGLPWYPRFAAFPAPMAPPIPNTPTPLSALTWSPTTLMPDVIVNAISQRFAGTASYAKELFMAVAIGFGDAVNVWMPQQMVMNVLGRGPVPSFAPPYVPVGPVVAGSIIEAPGHFP